MPKNPSISKLSQSIITKLKAKKLTLVLAESCTGGLIAHELTNISGASEVILGSQVVYQETAKISWLKIKPSLLKKYSAVSAECTEALVVSLLDHNPSADLSLAITGYLGPSAGPHGEDVGLVYISVFAREAKHPISLSFSIFPDRSKPAKKQTLSKSAKSQDINTHNLRILRKHMAAELALNMVHELL